jgi:flagellar protein FliO/FliZ
MLVNRFQQAWLSIIVMLQSGWVFAVETSTQAVVSETEKAAIGSAVTQPSDYFAQILISLVLVLLIIFVSAWLLRRYGRFPGVADGNLKVLGALSVGQRERILLLQVGKEQVLVGVTSSRITRLHQLEEPIEVKHNELEKSQFSQRLQEAFDSKKES